MLVVVVVVCVALLFAIFCREWGDPEDEGSGYMVKLKIVITHVQVLNARYALTLLWQPMKQCVDTETAF